MVAGPFYRHNILVSNSRGGLYRPWPSFDETIGIYLTSNLVPNPNPDRVEVYSRRICNEEMVWTTKRFDAAGQSRNQYQVLFSRRGAEQQCKIKGPVRVQITLVQRLPWHRRHYLGQNRGLVVMEGKHGIQE